MVLLPYLVFILLAVLASLYAARKIGQHGLATSVVSNLAALTRQNLPLPLGLELAAQHDTGKRALILRRLGRLVGQGTSLSGAIRQGWPRCPGIILSTVAVAERNHHLPLALRQLETYMADRTKRYRQFRFSNVFYPLVILSCCGFVFAGVMVVIVPKFKDIFEDFDTQIPPATMAVIHAADWLVGKAPGGRDHVPGLLLIGAMFVLAVGFFFAQRPRRPAKPLFFSRLSDTLKWYIPGWHRVEQASSLAHAAGCIRAGLLAGVPLHRAVRNSAELDLNIVVRNRLAAWADDLERGTPPAKAVHAAGLGAFFEWAFAGSAAGAALPDCLAFLQDYYHAAAVHWTYMIRQTLWPCVVIGLGITVGFLVYALFLPLTALIDSVAGFA